jgi:hypothetical protein
MFVKDKRTFLTLMIAFLGSSSWGCSAIIIHSGVRSPNELNAIQTRAEAQNRFGEPDETRTCIDGQIVEYRWIRKRIEGYKEYGQFFIASWGLSEIVYFPITAYQSAKAKLHYAFVYDGSGRLLYLYDLKAPPLDQFYMAMRGLAEAAYRQLKAEKFGTWSACITSYVKDARQRANCIGYTLDASEERELENLLTIGEWVDSGLMFCEDVLINIKETILIWFGVHYWKYW